MKNTLTLKGRTLALKTLQKQLYAGLFVSLLFTIIFDVQSGYFSLIGSGICLVSSASFAYFAFRYAGAQQNELVVRSFRKGSTFKLVITIVLFSIVFNLTEVRALPLFVGYIVTLIVQWPTLIKYSNA